MGEGEDDDWVYCGSCEKDENDGYAGKTSAGFTVPTPGRNGGPARLLPCERGGAVTNCELGACEDGSGRGVPRPRCGACTGIGWDG